MTLCNEATLGLVIAGSLLIVIKEDWKKTLAAMFAMLCAGNSTSAPGQGTHAALPNKSRNCKVGHPQLCFLRAALAGQPYRSPYTLAILTAG